MGLNYNLGDLKIFFFFVICKHDNLLNQSFKDHGVTQTREKKRKRDIIREKIVIISSASPRPVQNIVLHYRELLLIET